MEADPRLDPRAVSARLERLAASWVPLTEAQARSLMEDPAGLCSTGSFAERVAHRLAELRALCELTSALQQRGPERQEP